MTSLTLLKPISSALGDRMNPIVVREARQAVRSKAVFAALWLLLIALVVVTGVFALFSDISSSASEARGDDLFRQMNAVVMILCIVFVPIYTAWRFAGEHTGAAADLLHTTTVRPSSIVWGKLVVAMMVALLMFSAASPFLTLTYLFRGIDLLTIAFVVCLDVVALLVAAQAGVFVAAMRISGGLRIIIGIIALPMAVWTILSGTVFLGFSGYSVTSMGADAWIVIGTAIGMFLAIGGLMFCLSVSTTAPATTNRARLPRVYLTIMWALSLGIVAFVLDPASRTDFIANWFAVWSVLIAGAILFAGSERRQLGPRLLRAVPRARGARALAFLFTSGAGAGLLWAMLLHLASLVAYVFISKPLTHSGSILAPDDEWKFTIAWGVIPFFALAYTLLAVLVRDSLARRLSPGTTAPLAMFAAAACSIIPIVIAATLDPRGWDRGHWFYMANPLGAVFTLNERVAPTLIAGFGLIAAFLIVLLQAPWFARQIRAFKPLATLTDATTLPEPNGR